MDFDGLGLCSQFDRWCSLCARFQGLKFHHGVSCAKVWGVYIIQFSLSAYLKPMGIHPEQGLFVLQVRPPTELSVSRQHFLGFILHNVTPLGAPQKTSLQRLSSPLRMMTKMFNKTSCVAGASEFHGTERALTAPCCFQFTTYMAFFWPLPSGGNICSLL